MPIRFRCVYCNQLLGISRRKAGTIVRCTTCEGQLIVPDPNDPVHTEPAGTKDHVVPSGPPPTEAAGSLFEQSDFDALLEPAGPAAQPAVVASPPAPSSPAKAKRSSAGPPPLPVSSSTGVSAPAVVLTRQLLTLASVLLVLALGLSFASGLLLGLSLR
jgi:hypothetical protein